MDHHCPWFNNCVCFSTYKFFLLTLFYVVFLAAYAVASVAVYMLHKNPRRRLLHRSRHITFLLVVGGSTFVMMGGFLCAHLSFVVRNRTTIESARRPSFKESDDSFDIGARRNFLAVSVLSNVVSFTDWSKSNLDAFQEHGRSRQGVMSENRIHEEDISGSHICENSCVSNLLLAARSGALHTHDHRRKFDDVVASSLCRVCSMETEMQERLVLHCRRLPLLC
ncbi:hypothetical protein MRX96_051025 [Rhipicephalus microplus]